MIAFGKFLLILFAGLSVIYASLSLYARARRRDNLEAEWEEEASAGDRDTFIRAGLAEYDHSLRRRLILGVYVIPIVLIGTVIYFTNFN